MMEWRSELIQDISTEFLQNHLIRKEKGSGLFIREGIEISSVATSVKFSHTDETKRRKNIEQAKQDIKLASHLGANVVRIFAGGASGELNSDLAKIIGDSFTEVGEYAIQDEVCPMLETGHDIIEGSKEALQVIENVRTPNFGVLWNHAQLDDQVFNDLKNYIRHFHVHNPVLDEENEDIKDLAQKMKKVDYKGYISLEIIRGENMAEKELKETAQRLNKQIAEA